MTSEPPKIPLCTLSDGSKIQKLGFGTGTAWYKEGGQGPFNQELVVMIKEAVKQGYRHLDCAEAYGTEEELGIAIKECGVPREELFVTTKVVETIEEVPRAIDTSLKKLQLDYVDLYLIHSPYFAKSDEDIQNAWKAMEAVQHSGKAKAIGLSSFLRPHVEAVLKVATIKPVVNQIEFHPYLQRANGYVPWLQNQGIEVQSFFGLAPITHAKGGPLDEIITRLAKKYSVDESAILINWHLEQNIINISTTTKPERIQQYFAAIKLNLTRAEVEEISQIGNTHHVRIRLAELFDADDRT